MHRAWIDLKAAVTGKDSHAVLNECERGEDVRREGLRRRPCKAQDLPSALKSVIEKQYSGRAMQPTTKSSGLRDSSK
ncbi:MAG: PA2169 family four-helix-bundle protein [Hymenobacter sp.]